MPKRLPAMEVKLSSVPLDRSIHWIDWKSNNGDEEGSLQTTGLDRRAAAPRAQAALLSPIAKQSSQGPQGRSLPIMHAKCICSLRQETSERPADTYLERKSMEV